MDTVAQPTTTHKRIAYHATLRGEHGTAIRNHRGEVWFVSDDDTVSQLGDADMPGLMLYGRVDLACDQRRRDLEAQTDLSRIETQAREAAILTA